MRNKFNAEQRIPNGRASQKFMEVNRKLREKLEERCMDIRR